MEMCQMEDPMFYRSVIPLMNPQLPCAYLRRADDSHDAYTYSIVYARDNDLEER